MEDYQQSSRRMEEEEAAAVTRPAEREAALPWPERGSSTPGALRGPGSPSEESTRRCIPETGDAIPRERVISKAGTSYCDEEYNPSEEFTRRCIPEAGDAIPRRVQSKADEPTYESTAVDMEQTRLSNVFRRAWRGVIRDELRKLEREDARHGLADDTHFRCDTQNVCEPEFEDRYHGIDAATRRNEREDRITWGHDPRMTSHDLPHASNTRYATSPRYATLPQHDTRWGYTAHATQQRNNTAQASHYRNITVISQNQAAARQGVPRDLPGFAGDVESWPLFISSYNRTTAACGYSDDENLIRLQHALSGIALETVGHLLSFPEGLQEAMATLEARFGRPDLIVESLIAKIKKMAVPKMEKLSTIVDFGFAVKRLIGAAQASGLRGYLYDVALLKELVKSLPSVLCIDWARHRRSLPQVTLMEFGRWIGDLADDLCRVIDMPNVLEADTVQRSTQQQQQFNRPQPHRFQPHRSHPQQFQPHRSHPQQFQSHRIQTQSAQPDRVINRQRSDSTHAQRAYCNATAVFEGQNPGTEPSPELCILCNGKCPSLCSCYKFLNTTVAARRSFINERRLCRRCLGSHKGRCSVSAPCGIDSCEVQHHALLHVDNGPTQNKAHMECSPDSGNISDNDAASVFTHTGCKDEVLLKYVPVMLHGPLGRVDTYAFLDDGSTSTFMDHGLLKELGITGTPHPLCLQWTGDVTREEKNSVRVSMRISGRNGSPTEYELKDVHTVKELALPIQSVDVGQLVGSYTHLKGLPLQSYERVSPRVLIGINNCSLSQSLNSKERRGDEPIASKTRLGWVVYGPCPVAKTTPNRTRQSFQVRLNGSSDDLLTVREYSVPESRLRDMDSHEVLRVGGRLSDCMAIDEPTRNPTSRELDHALQNVDNDELTTKLCGPQTRWTFNPPGALHFGVCWERSIRSLKKVLNQFIFSRHPTDEDLMSCFTEIGRLNSRPLNYVPLDNELTEPVTPNSLPLGSSDGSKPPAAGCDGPSAVKSIWKLAQHTAVTLGKWVADYLPTLTRRTKWYKARRPVQIGYVVVIGDNIVSRKDASNQ